MISFSYLIHALLMSADTESCHDLYHRMSS
ncbi:MAG: hypothetical protein F6Q13_02500 [Mycobacterium sp.]|nr:MAG: hypothetical protein F6Q13_02500 [Mycobacterium sp.]